MQLASALQPPLLLPQCTTAAKGTQDVLVMGRLLAYVVYARCSLAASQQQQTPQPLTTSAQQARIEPPLTCASEAVASEARLAGAVAGATTKGAGGISAAAAVVVGARVHGCKRRTCGRMWVLSAYRSAAGLCPNRPASQAQATQRLAANPSLEQQACNHIPLTYACVAIADEARIAGAFVALRNVGARGIPAAASVVGAAMDHS